MEFIMNKIVILGGISVVLGAVSAAFGGWSTTMTMLVIFMGIDYLTGLIVAGVFKNSGKTENGSLESRAGWKGIFRKGVTLLIVLVAAQLDKLMEFDFIRHAVVIAYITNETISIIENAGLMGVPIPGVIRKAIDILNKELEEGKTGDDS